MPPDPHTPADATSASAALPGSAPRMSWPDAIELRLRQLRADQAAGEASLRELDQRRELLTASLLRLGGAIQVLEEMSAHRDE